MGAPNAAGHNQVVGVVGRRGSGKSTVATALLKRASCLVVWDPMDEHNWCPNRLVSIAELKDFLGWSRHQETFAARFVPLIDLPIECDGFCAAVYQRGCLVVGLEEVPMVCSAVSLPAGFDRLVRLGRHAGVSVLWTAQRMAEAARRLTAATDWFVLFSQTEPRDLEALADRCGQAVAEQVRALPRYVHLVWDVCGNRLAELQEIAALF